MKFNICATFIVILAINFDGIQGAPQPGQEDPDNESPPPKGPGFVVHEIYEGTGDQVLNFTYPYFYGTDRALYEFSGRRTPRFGVGVWNQKLLRDVFHLGNLTLGELLPGLDQIIEDIHKGDFHGAVHELTRIGPETIEGFIKSLREMFEQGGSLDFQNILKTLSAYITPLIPTGLLPHLGSFLTIVLVICFSLSIRL